MQQSSLAPANFFETFPFSPPPQISKRNSRKSRLGQTTSPAMSERVQPTMIDRPSSYIQRPASAASEVISGDFCFRSLGLFCSVSSVGLDTTPTAIRSGCEHRSYTHSHPRSITCTRVLCGLVVYGSVVTNDKQQKEYLPSQGRCCRVSYLG